MESHLLQMRGLKPAVLYGNLLGSEVASFTDAWIETREGLLKISSFRVASFTDAWIETDSGGEDVLTPLVASFTDAWIETER